MLKGGDIQYQHQISIKIKLKTPKHSTKNESGLLDCCFTVLNYSAAGASSSASTTGASAGAATGASDTTFTGTLTSTSLWK